MPHTLVVFVNRNVCSAWIWLNFIKIYKPWLPLFNATESEHKNRGKNSCANPSYAPRRPHIAYLKCTYTTFSGNYKVKIFFFAAVENGGKRIISADFRRANNFPPTNLYSSTDELEGKSSSTPLAIYFHRTCLQLLCFSYDIQSSSPPPAARRFPMINVRCCMQMLFYSIPCSSNKWTRVETQNHQVFIPSFFILKRSKALRLTFHCER